MESMVNTPGTTGGAVSAAAADTTPQIQSQAAASRPCASSAAGRAPHPNPPSFLKVESPGPYPIPRQVPPVGKPQVSFSRPCAPSSAEPVPNPYPPSFSKVASPGPSPVPRQDPPVVEPERVSTQEHMTTVYSDSFGRTPFDIAVRLAMRSRGVQKRRYCHAAKVIQDQFPEWQFADFVPEEIRREINRVESETPRFIRVDDDEEDDNGTNNEDTKNSSATENPGISIIPVKHVGTKHIAPGLASYVAGYTGGFLNGLTPDGGLQTINESSPLSHSSVALLPEGRLPSISESSPPSNSVSAPLGGSGEPDFLDHSVLEPVNPITKLSVGHWYRQRAFPRGKMNSKDDLGKLFEAAGSLDESERRSCLLGGGAQGRVWLAGTKATHTFKSGAMGITCDDNGVVQDVSPDGPARAKRISKGDQILSVDGQRYSDKAAMEAEGSGVGYEIVVLKVGELYAIKNICTGAKNKRAYDGDKDFYRREEQMYTSIRTCSHPCLAKLIAAHHFRDVKMYMITMEYFAHGTVAGMIRSCLNVEYGTYVPPQNAPRWCAQILLAHEHLCANKIMLRDIKPDNVMISDSGIAKLIDFDHGCVGQPKSDWGKKDNLSFDNLQRRALRGTPGYVAPEMLYAYFGIGGAGYDERIDLYSIGVTIWAIMSGGIRKRDQYGFFPLRTWLETPFKCLANPIDDLAARCSDDHKFLKWFIEHPGEPLQRHPEPTGSDVDKRILNQISMKLDEHWKKLVLDLTDIDPKQRPTHTKIRQEYNAIQEMKLPKTSNREDVIKWLGEGQSLDPKPKKDVLDEPMLDPSPCLSRMPAVPDESPQLHRCVPFHRLFRMPWFLVFPILSSVAQVFSLCFFAYYKKWFCFSIVFSGYLVSGYFCARALIEGDVWGLRQFRCCLKFREKGLGWSFLGTLLMTPLLFVHGLPKAILLVRGLFKYMMIPEEETPSEVFLFNLNRYHYNAVLGMMEDNLIATAILFTYWNDPLSPFQRVSLAIVGIVAFLTAGFSIMELDLRVSAFAQDRRSGSLWKSTIHWLFRTFECMYRISLFVCFAVVMLPLIGDWCFCPFSLEVLISTALLSCHGGEDDSLTLKLACALTSCFANVFLFIDSPYKERACRKISNWLQVRNAVEAIIFALILWCFRTPDGSAAREFLDLIERQKGLKVSMVAFCLYLPLRMYFSRCCNEEPPDIYTACENAQEAEVIHCLAQSRSLRPDVDEPDIFGRTPLMLAASTGHFGICERLLDNNASVDKRVFTTAGHFCYVRECFSRPQRDWTALHFAAWNGDRRVLELLCREARQQSTSSPVD